MTLKLINIFWLAIILVLRTCCNFSFFKEHLHPVFLLHSVKAGSQRTFWEAVFKSKDWKPIFCRHTISSEKEKIFAHSIIDPSPPSEKGCCLDVLALGDVDGNGLLDIVVGSQYLIGVV